MTPRKLLLLAHLLALYAQMYHLSHRERDVIDGIIADCTKKLGAVEDADDIPF